MAVLLRIHDVFPDGRVLMSTQYAKMACSCQAPGETRPRDVGWLDGSGPEALSADGRTVLFAEVLRGGGTMGAIYLRGTDGSDAVRLGDGFPEDLSPDGRWVLATPVVSRQDWILVPTGAGSRRTLPRGPVVSRGEANFLPDGRQIVFGGAEKGRGLRIYVQDIDGGPVRAISPEHVSTTALATIDSRSVLGRSNGRHFRYPIDGNAPVALPFLSSNDVPLQWTPDGKALYVWRTLAWPPAVDRVDVATGRREQWKSIQPADPVGVDSVFRIVISPDGRAYCHDYVRFLSELFIVEGLK
jgi:Tol biopolymer transport system component